MGDIRVERGVAHLVDSVVETGSLVLKRVGKTRAGEVKAGRLLDHPDVDPEAVFALAVARTRAAVAGRHIVVSQDTTEINFAGCGGRRHGLGPAGDGVSPGFFIHPQIAIDAATGDVLGLVGAEIWTRDMTKAEDRRGRAAEDKESRRWLGGVRTALERLGPVAASVTVVGDRESDIYGLFAGRPSGVELIVRAAQNRSLVMPEACGAHGSLFVVADGWPVLARETVEVAARRIGAAGGPAPARPARLEVRAGAVELLRPKARKANDGDAPSVTLSLVEVREVGAPAGVTPIVWRLLATRKVATAAEAQEVVRCYRLRWRIEETFRTLKTDGLDLEATQVTTPERLFNLAAIGLVASVRIMQLVDARDGSTRPATDVIDARDIAAAAAIGATLEGATPRQRNRWPKGTLAWLAWIAARLGGWNCYGRPPGPKTMAAGWKRLAERLAGYHLAARTGPPPAQKIDGPLHHGTSEAQR